MTSQAQPFLPEMPEHQATGAIAVIYDEIRRFSGVTYVSSLQRYLATIPGVLEWAWDSLRPAMRSGAIPAAGWHLAEAVRIPHLPPVTAESLRPWGVSGTDLQLIRAIGANFVRVSPVNLVTGACLKLLLTGPAPSGRGFDEGWVPPSPLPPMPGNVDMPTLTPVRRAVLLRFATDVNGSPFVPALYRQLAHWPALLSWLADVLVPLLAAPETAAARTAFRAAAAATAPGIVARLPGPAPEPRPDDATTQRVLGAIDHYAVTSPEMTMFGQALLNALPAAAG